MPNIPRIVHYCWFGRGEMPQQAVQCIASWHRLMPDWQYRLWNEECFDVQSTPYTAEAYAAGKYAFVSDYVRLYALEHYGGVYLDTDVMLLKPLDDLLRWQAFAGFEGSKHLPVGTCVLGSVAHGTWVTDMLRAYGGLRFLLPTGQIDTTTNVQRLTALMAAQGLQQNGKEQDCAGLHIFPVEYFSPRRTTGEYISTANTYADHLGLGSWTSQPKGWRRIVPKLLGQRATTRLIKLKRRLIG